VTAPLQAGSYHHVWQMREVTGTNPGLFGATIDVPVTVSGSFTPEYGAGLISQTVPSVMSTGQPYTVTVTMQNSGSTAWSAGAVSLGSLSTPSNVWGVTAIQLSNGETVAPGAS